MDKAKKTTLQFKFLIAFVAITTIIIILTAYVKYIYAKDYFFLVETPCNPETEICHVRSCDDYCPPNGLENYKTYSIKADLYDQCEQNSCVNICESEESKTLCDEVVCDPDEGYECSI